MRIRKSRRSEGLALRGIASTKPAQSDVSGGDPAGPCRAAVLWAMWIAHQLLFRGNTFAEWIGLVIVVQISWVAFQFAFVRFCAGLGLCGVGVAGGMAMKAQGHKAQMPRGLLVRSANRQPTVVFRISKVDIRKIGF